jgi:enterochelin esterase-like enzyme
MICSGGGIGVKVSGIATAIMGLLISLILAGCQSQRPSSRENPAPKATVLPSVSARPDQASVTAVPQPTSTQHLACPDAEGQLQENTYPGLVYKHELPYLVYLPPCYVDNGQSYPVVYLLHGYPYDQTHWLDLGLVQAYEQGVVSKGWPRVIFILPTVPEPLFTRTDGGVGSYEQEFIEGLLPAIEGRYRVLPNPAMRVLAGVSRGGVWALEIGLRNSDLIYHISAVSPALVYNQPRLRYDPFQIVREQRRSPATLFLSAAENETPFREDIEAFVRLLELQEIGHTFLLHPGNHNNESWKAHIEEILMLLLAGVSS